MSVRGVGGTGQSRAAAFSRGNVSARSHTLSCHTPLNVTLLHNRLHHPYDSPIISAAVFVLEMKKAPVVRAWCSRNSPHRLCEHRVLLISDRGTTRVDLLQTNCDICEGVMQPNTC
jgi:hypothetical protein